MRLKKWQRAAIDKKLDDLREKYHDPETLKTCEKIGTEFHREWRAWCESTDWMVDYDRIASEARRDNVVRHALPEDDEGFPEFWAQAVLPLDADDGIVIVAADARQTDLQEHMAMRRKQLDDQIAAASRYIVGIRDHAARFQNLSERWIDVQRRSQK